MVGYVFCIAFGGACVHAVDSIDEYRVGRHLHQWRLVLVSEVCIGYTISVNQMFTHSLSLWFSFP